MLTRHLRKKYRCPCYAAVVMAPEASKLISARRNSPAFAIDLAISRYLDHLPLERQCWAMEREGLAITSQTQWDQIDALARVLTLTYEALGQGILAQPELYADETRWRFSGRDERKPDWVWCLTGPRDPPPDRGAARDRTHRACETRRRLRRRSHGSARAAPSAALASPRAWVDQIRAWTEVQSALPRSGLGEAVSYLLGLRPRVARFLDDPRIPLDNALAE